MSLNGYYDENGNWQRTKFCFMACRHCDCMPPSGLHYSAAHDKRLKKLDPTSDVKPIEKHQDRRCPHLGLCNTYGCDGDCQ